MSKKRPHEKTSSSHRDNSAAAKKPSRNELGKSSSGANSSGVNAVSGAGLDLPDKISRGNGGNGTIAAPAAITVDTNSSDHVVAITYLKERIASLEKRLNQKDKELLEKDKQVGDAKAAGQERGLIKFAKVVSHPEKFAHTFLICLSSCANLEHTMCKNQSAFFYQRKYTLEIYVKYSPIASSHNP